MGNKVIVIGMQWGDEGKGKIVDVLSQHADRVVRFNGGHNAGHTLVVNGQKWKLALLPCGLLHGKPGVIGNGVVIDPHALLAEIDRIGAQGCPVSPANLAISASAVLVLPVHRAVEAADEARRAQPIGTTGRGIGPALEDKVGRRAIRIADLAEPATLASKVNEAVAYHNARLRGLGLPECDAAALLADLLALAPRILPYATSTWQQLDDADQRGERILFEGAQAMLLDVDHGTYPFVTSSNAAAGQAAIGSGLGAAGSAQVLGISKAYATRVGAGPFPTELSGNAGDLLRQRGAEYGTNTGRPRRCGWLDAALLRQSIKTGGANSLVLTKLDVLDTLAEISICTGYHIDGVFSAVYPASAAAQAKAQPVYEVLPGWQQSTVGIRDWDALPAAAQNYIRRIEALTGTPIAMISTSPERDDMIVLAQPFA